MPEEILGFYARGLERGRLGQGIGPLELARTRELLQRFLPEPAAVVCDIGGGPGAYAFWLTGLGYQVHLIDVAPLHIEQAREAEAAAGVVLAGMQVGDARRLNLGDAVADAIILHGPLYHLTERTDRMAVLAEAHRVLKPAGALMAFGITRYASLIVGLVRGWVFADQYMAMVAEELSSGHHHKPPNLEAFTRAYFHHPDELRAELHEARFDVQATFGVEGPAWMVPEFGTDWQDEARRRAILEVARMMEHEPVMSPHFVAVARRTET